VRYLALAAAFLFLSPAPAQADEVDGKTYDWIGVKATGSGAVVGADCDIGQTRGSVWAAVGGTQFLDIVQIGTLEGRYFAAWGSGYPYQPNSYYKQVDLGESTPGPHRYTVWLKPSGWWLYIDQKVRVVVPDDFRRWKVRSRQLQTETNSPADHFGPGTWCRARTGGGWHLTANGFTAIAYPSQPIVSRGRTVGFRLQ